MSLTPLDEQTFKLAAATLNRGRVQGVSPIAALHTAGLLLGPDLACRIREEILNSAAEQILRTKFVDLLGERFLHHSATPSEVRKAIADRLEVLATLARRGDFR